MFGSLPHWVTGGFGWGVSGGVGFGFSKPPKLGVSPLGNRSNVDYNSALTSRESLHVGETVVTGPRVSEIGIQYEIYGYV